MGQLLVAFNILVLLLWQMEVLHNACNMCIRDLSDMNALILQAWAYISGKSLMPMLPLLHETCNYEQADSSLSKNQALVR